MVQPLIMKYDYEINRYDDYIEINIDDDNYFETPLSEFWDYIKSNKLHHYCHDYYSPTEYDGHGQDRGKLSFDEYFDQPYETIKENLTQYLLTPKFKKHF